MPGTAGPEWQVQSHHCTASLRTAVALFLTPAAIHVTMAAILWIGVVTDNHHNSATKEKAAWWWIPLENMGSS